MARHKLKSVLMEESKSYNSNLVSGAATPHVRAVQQVSFSASVFGLIISAIGAL